MNLIRSRCFAALLLCLYGMAATPVTSLAFMSMAMISDEHEVQVIMDGHGSMEVVLHHHHALTPGIHSHSRAVDRLLASLCKSGDSGDHVFNMSASSPSMEPKVSRADSATKSGRLKISAWCLITSHAAHRLQPLKLLPQAVFTSDHRARNGDPRPCMGSVVLLV